MSNKGPTPVMRLQELCKDILKNGAIVDKKRYWCKRVSDKSNPYYSTATSVLVKKGVLNKISINVDTPFGKQLPHTFFEDAGYVERRWVSNAPKASVLVYLVVDEQVIAELSRSKTAAAKYLGFQPMVAEGPMSYKKALERIKKEINEHPDPAVFLMQVIRSLVKKD